MDFGVELAAWVEFQAASLAPQDAADCVRVSISEMAVPQEFTYRSTPWKTVAPTPYDGGWYRAEYNPALYEGVRRAFVHVLPAGEGGCNHHDLTFTITAVRAVGQNLPVNWNGSFSAPGAVLAQTWYTAAYTVKLNTLPGGFGAILDDRGDRTAFAGDDHPTQAAAMAAFGLYPYIRHSLLTTMSAATEYFSYNLFWILSVHDYFQKTADAALVRQVAPIIKQKLAMLQNNTNGNVPHGNAGFIGWDERLDGLAFVCALPENQYAFTAIYVQAAKAAADLFAAVGDTAGASTAAQQGKAVEAVARAAPSWWSAWGLHALAHAVLANMTTQPERVAMFQRSFTNATQICSLSNFNQYYILKALEGLDQPTAALDSIRLCWGQAELMLGATTFWEISGLAGQWGPVLQPFIDGVGGRCPPPVPAHSGGSTSLAHPWSAGVTAWLTDSALGVRPVVPGYRHFQAAPLLPVVAGSVPLPDGGLISAAFNATSGRHELSWSAGVESAHLRVPVACRSDDRMELGIERIDSVGRTVVTQTHIVQAAPLPWAIGAGLFDVAVETTLSMPGPAHHRLHVTCLSAADNTAQAQSARQLLTEAPQVYSQFDWLAPVVARDNVTQGSWVGKYGKRGHLLMGSCNVTNRSSLPAGVSVDTNRFISGCWTNNATGTSKAASALQRPAGAGPDAPRFLGTAHTDFMTAGAVDIVFADDVFTNATPCFNISLYFCDWDSARSVDNGGGLQVRRRMAMDVLALPGREVAWATTVLAETGALPTGEYVTFEACDARLSQGVRIRLYLIFGDNAPVSAIFFD